MGLIYLLLTIGIASTALCGYSIYLNSKAAKKAKGFKEFMEDANLLQMYDDAENTD